MTLCDLVYIIEAAKRSRAVTVNWQHVGGVPRGLGAQQMTCQLATLNADQVKKFAPQAQRMLDALRPSGQDVAECIARYCKDYGCPVDTVKASKEQVCQLVYVIKAAQYGRTVSVNLDGNAVTLSGEQAKSMVGKIGQTLKDMLDKGITTSDVVRDCEKLYCVQYGCNTGGGGGGGASAPPACPEGSYPDASGVCVASDVPPPNVNVKKGGFGWLAVAGIAATLAKKVLFVSALSGAPKLVELEDEDEE